MKKVLISIIGKPQSGEYNKTKYRIEDSIYDTTFSFLPMLEYYNPNNVFLIGTKDSIWDKIPENIDYEKIIIPFGIEQDDQWQIFKILSELELENCEITFDLTHGFRTIPFISLLAMYYYRSVKKSVIIKRVLYGIYEARDVNNITPVVDLAGYLSIFDWIFAAKTFANFGNGKELCEMIDKFPGKQMEKLGQSISDVNLAIQLGYMSSLPLYIEAMKENLTKMEHAEQLPQFIPFKMVAPLFKEVTDLVGPQKKEYEKLLDIADWYYKNDQIAKAILTLRESFITFIGNMAKYDISKYKNREDIKIKFFGKHKFDKESLIQKYKSLKKFRDRFWEINGFRNTIGHADVATFSGVKIEKKEEIRSLLYSSRILFNNMETNSDFKQCLEEIQKSSWYKPFKEKTIEDLMAKFNKR